MYISISKPLPLSSYPTFQEDVSFPLPSIHICHPHPPLISPIHIHITHSQLHPYHSGQRVSKDPLKNPLLVLNHQLPLSESKLKAH